MDINQQQYQLILSQGHIPKERLDQAFSHPNRRVYSDFVEFLIHSLMLRADIALKIREQVKTTPIPPPISTPSVMPEMTVGELERAYQQALSTNPLFSPHARDQFKLIEKLGEGGMGVVHRIEDKNLGRSAALKVLSTVDANPRAVARFIREARITARLVHPNIPPVYELGMNSSREHYMLMKVIEGQSLKAAIAEVHGSGNADPKEVRQLLEALVKVCEAMAYAHSKEIIHRDLKPENIMIGEFGEVMVLDWGLARDFSDQKEEEITGPDSELSLQLRAAAQQEGLTGAGDLLGTVGYMAPEQVDGQACKQSDVFALGAILTEILTGKKAIAGDSVISKLSATIQGRIKAPRDLSRSASKELNVLAMDAMEMALEDRLESVEGIVLDLKAYLAGAYLSCYRYGLLERSQRWMSRHPTFLSSGFLLLLLLGSALLFKLAIDSAKQERMESEKKRTLVLNEKKAVETVGRLFDQAESAANAKLFTGESINLVVRALKVGGRTEANLLRAARIYIKGGRYALSRNLYKECVSNFPPAYEALFRLHNLEVGDANPMGDSVYLQELRKLIDQGPTDNVYRVIVKMIDAYHSRKWAEVVELSKRIESNKESGIPLYHVRAFALGALGQNELAVAEYVKRLKLFPKEYKTMVNIAVAKQKVGEFQSAISYCDRAIAINPSYRDAFLSRAKANISLKRTEEAITDYKKAHLLDPRNTKLCQVLANNLTKIGKLKDALVYYHKIVGINSKDASRWVLRGTHYEKMGDYNAAGREYERALLLNPNYMNAYYKLGDLYNRQRLFRKALVTINKGIARGPGESRFYYVRGRVYHDSKDLRSALKDYSKAIELKENDPTIYVKRGSVLEALGLPKRAASDFEIFLKHNPKWVLAKKLRTYIQRALNRPSRY